MLKRLHSRHSYNEQTRGCLGRGEASFCYPHAQLHREIQDWSVSSVVVIVVYRFFLVYFGVYTGNSTLL